MHKQTHGSAYSRNSVAKTHHNTANGRIDILGPTVEQQFAMYDKIPNSSTCASFRDAMIGNWENTALSDAFFSTGNMQIVQNGLRNGAAGANPIAPKTATI